MMSKIISAVNSMIANQDKISKVTLVDNGEIYFLYDGKYKWSIRNNNDGISLWYYPSNDSIEYLTNVINYDPNIPMVHYSSDQIGTVEAHESFRELYTVVKEKVFGVDEVLDDIIKDLF